MPLITEEDSLAGLTARMLLVLRAAQQDGDRKTTRIVIDTLANAYGLREPAFDPA